MAGDRINEHSFKNITVMLLGPVDIFYLIHHDSLKTSIKFIFTVFREGKEVFKCLILKCFNECDL